MSKKNIYHHKNVAQEYIANEGLVPANITDFTWDKICTGVSLIFPRQKRKQTNGKWELEWNSQKELIIWSKKTEYQNNIVTLEMVTLSNYKIRIAYDKNANGISPEYVYKDEEDNICVYPDYVGWDCMTDISHFAFQYFANGKCNGNIDDKSSFSRACITVYDNTVFVDSHITNEDLPKIMQNVSIGGTIKYPIKFGTEFVDARVYDAYSMTLGTSSDGVHYSDIFILTEYGMIIDFKGMFFNFSSPKGSAHYKKIGGDEKVIFLQPDIDFSKQIFRSFFWEKTVFYMSPDYKKLSMIPKEGYIELQNNTSCIKYLINCVLALNNIPIYEDKLEYDNMELAYQCFNYLCYSQKNTCETGVFDGEFYQNYFSFSPFYFFWKNNINTKQSWFYKKEELEQLTFKIKKKFFQLHDVCLGWSYSPYQIRKEYDPSLDNGELGKMLDEQDKMVEEFFEEKIKPLIPYKW